MRDGRTQAAAPSPWVARFIEGVRSGGRVLDVACGGGRHLALGLARGLHMVGIDRDISTARDLVGAQGTGTVELISADLEDGSPPPFRGQIFDGVVVTNYLWRPILGDIVAAVSEAGVLIYETFSQGNERLGRPSNPDFLLRPGELLGAVGPRLRTIAFEHVRLTGPERIVQRICAVGPRHPWPTLDSPRAF
jgi:SAM-dependent methyltransferase